MSEDAWDSHCEEIHSETGDGYLYHLINAIVDSLPLVADKGADKDILKVITEPFTKLIIQIDKNAINKIADGTDPDFDYDRAIMKVCCDKKTPAQCCETKKSKVFKTAVNYTHAQKTGFCQELSACVGRNQTWHEDCTSTPWSNKTWSIQRLVTQVDCDAFQGTRSEVDCCKKRIDLNQTLDCSGVSSCFSSSSHNFSLSSCAVSNVSVMDELVGEDFSCTLYTRDVEKMTCFKECEFLFKGMYSTLNDKAIGAIMLVISLTILCLCLVAIVKLLLSLLQGPIALIIKKFINADFPGPLGYLTGYLTIIIGAGLTIIVQSSSIFTSTLTPLVGIGVIELDRMYPLTLGSNIGTTTTAILSALANTDGLRNALQAAFCHLFFNITGILLFYLIPYLRFPIPLAKFLGNCTAEYRWFAIVYILLMFFLFPALVFALSIPGWYVLLGFLGPVCLLFIIIGVIKCLQAKRPQSLPRKLQDWMFLPQPLLSLEPYDRAMQKVFFCKRFQTDSTEKTDTGATSDRQANGESSTRL
ncbi:sodium-dependent phosphate transport protein 2B-like [Physella acuta]|uniref:sodium-dependent phosphate transport protein 2B-like n=1 Tax=Physella acuta TaxID=109671 RepID=UPI0027DE2E6A|nr:sodium-dependent phosphate transport protein 2B-like [Physella acuta]